MFTLLAVIALIAIVVISIILVKSCNYEETSYKDYDNEQTK